MPEKSYEDLLFEDPAAAVEQLKQELRNEYTVEQNRQRFWTEFYRENPDLREHDDIVRLTMSKNLADLAQKPVPDAAKEIAELSRKRLAELRGGEEYEAPAPQAFEGGPDHGSPFTEPRRKRGSTLGDLINARKEMRREHMRLRPRPSSDETVH